MVKEENTVGDDIPLFTIGGIIDVIKRKGPLGAYNDEEMGPHIHLTYLLSAIVLIAIIIGGVILIMGY